jgi:hypothetical protein
MVVVVMMMMPGIKALGVILRLLGDQDAVMRRRVTALLSRQ